MELTSDLKQKLVQRVKHFTDLANQKYSLNMPYPVVKFAKAGTTAGTANSSTHTVNFNAGLYVRNVDEFLSDTVPHEVAHLVQYRLHPSTRRWTGNKWVRTVQPHGFEWQQVMRSFGVAPDRCHQMDTSEVRRTKNVTKYDYKCNCKTHSVGAKVHSKIQKGAVYTCKLCRGQLTSSTFVAVKRPSTPVVTKAPEPATKLPKVGSKKEQAENYYLQYQGKDRELVVAIFMNELGMTKAGASTYYYNCQKKFS